MAAAVGVFYVLKLPPGRVKVGFSANTQHRMRNIKTFVPDAEIMGEWPTRAIWESTARHSVTRGLRWIGGEVYECENPEAVVDRAAEFFALMPAPNEVPTGDDDSVSDEEDDE